MAWFVRMSTALGFIFPGLFLGCIAAEPVFDDLEEDVQLPRPGFVGGTDRGGSPVFPGGGVPDTVGTPYFDTFLSTGPGSDAESVKEVIGPTIVIQNCPSFMQCLSLSSNTQDSEIKKQAQEACLGAVEDPGVKDIANALYDCLQVSGCSAKDELCVTLNCPQEAEACNGGGGGELVSDAEAVEEDSVNEEGIDSSVTPGSCDEGEIYCPAALISPLPVQVENVKTGFAPELLGGSLQDGDYGLTKVIVYTGSAAVDGELPLEFDFKLNDSSGAIRIENGAWLYRSKMELVLSVIGPLGLSQDIPKVSEQVGGGCITVEGNRIWNNLYECTDPPFPNEEKTEFQYEFQNNTLRVLLRYPVKEVVKSLENFADQVIFSLAQAVLVNDIQMILVLSPL